MTDAPALTCPSARAEPGAVLLGLKGANGRIVHLRTALPVDTAFLENAATHGPPEARMRFAAPCQRAGCAQWTGHACGVIQRVLGHLEPRPDLLAEGLQPCLIRKTCRWYAEHGGTACRACDLVVTDQAAVAAE